MAKSLLKYMAFMFIRRLDFLGTLQPAPTQIKSGEVRGRYHFWIKIVSITHLTPILGVLIYYFDEVKRDIYQHGWILEKLVAILWTSNNS